MKTKSGKPHILHREEDVDEIGMQHLSVMMQEPPANSEMATTQNGEAVQAKQAKKIKVDGIDAK